MRILIAEDDEMLSRSIRQRLEGEHHAVDVFPDGEQARTAATQFEDDVVILDLNPPKQDGVSALRHLRAKKPKPDCAGVDPACASARPGRVPEYGRRRLSGQAIFLQPTLRSHSGAGAAQPPAVGVCADRGRPQARPGATDGRARRQPDRSDHGRVFPTA